MALKAKEIHKMKDEEMREEIGRLRHRLHELRTQGVTEKLENPRELGNLRRDIARILTEQNSRHPRNSRNPRNKAKQESVQ